MVEFECERIYRRQLINGGYLVFFLSFGIIVKHRVKKQENVGFYHFLLFPPCFRKASSLKCRHIMPFLSTSSERLKLNVEERWCQWELLCKFKSFFRTSVLRWFPGITDVHWRSHKSPLALFQRRWVTTNVSPNVRKRWRERHGVTAPSESLAHVIVC